MYSRSSAKFKGKDEKEHIRTIYTRIPMAETVHVNFADFTRTKNYQLICDSNVHVHVSAVLTRDNQDDFVDLVKYMSSRGIATQISPYHHFNPRDEDLISITDRKKCEKLVETLLSMKDEGYLIASSKGFIEHLTEFFCSKERIPKDYRCLIGYTNLFVDAYMNVRPCWDWCFKPLGNLKEKRLADIWNGALMKEYREQMLRCQCGGCWYMCTGEVSMMLEDKL